MKSLEIAQKSLFVLAHPDDELLFAHAIQAHIGQPDTQTFILVATNGEASSVDLRGKNFVATSGRKQEVRQSLDSLGIPADRQYYRDLQDGSLDFKVPELAGTIARITLQEGITTLFTFDEQGYDNHTDHQSTYRAAKLLSGRLSLQHLVRTRDAAEAEACIEGPEESKLAIIRSHASQFDGADREQIDYMTETYSGGLTDEYYRPAA